MSAGERAWPLVEVGAVAMVLPLAEAGTMQAQPPTFLVLLPPMLSAAVLSFIVIFLYFI